MDNRRLQIVTLHVHTSKTIRQIPEYSKRSKSAVGRVLFAYQKTGDLHSSKTNCGRRRISTAAEDRLLIRMSKKDAKASSVDLKSTNGIQRRAHDTQNRHR